MNGLQVIRRVFANRNYRLYVIGNLFSTSGNWVQRVAMGWLTWELTDSAAWLGIIAFADMFPTFVIGLIAGALVDRTDSMRLLRTTQFLQFLQVTGLAAVTFSGHVTVWWLLAFALIRGVLVAFNRPARMTTVYYIIGREHLSSAIAINSMVFNSSRFVGPALGGALVALGGAGWAFAYNGFTYLAFLLILMMIRIPPTAISGKKKTGLWKDSMDGVRYALGQSGIMFLLIVMLLDSMFVRPFIDLLPGFADKVFGRGVDAYSTMLTLHGIGAMLGGYYLASRGGVAGFTRLLVASLLLLALSLLIFTTVHVYWVALPIMFLTGIGFVVQGVAIQTMLQTSVMPEMRGRVMGIYGVVGRGGPALGALVMGALSEIFGLPLTVGAGAVLCLLLWAWATTRQGRMAEKLERDPEEAPSESERRHALD
jgi:predicted MFS family arabinose efflux permease